ncbi:MAG: PDR/VanB family oxidoreductase [Hydrogenophaga sp.]|uniref:PDR/VanB family oxidoreductase n=1 Tax=Hydrogenophaga sp. TaxID=1904254 RepID=UPI002612A2F9|nr:PDR/VanB family oxidoreductase [Hydrogenophaga sp.]MCV0438751.1 PDR/VanB family oxidoreductase [Hydrogenophaga sp.]
MTLPSLVLRVTALEWQAEGILSLRLRAKDGAVLPSYEPGAHIDLTLAPGLTRSYSLLDGCPGPEPASYRVGVALDVRSRGGSAHVHRELRPGDVLVASAPRNHFPLVETAPFTQLVAGGIGITPMIAMAERLSALGRAWRLRWCVRDLDHLPFGDWLAQHADRIDLHVDARDGGVWNGWTALVQGLPGDAHLYCCGPSPMLAAYEDATRNLDPARVHLERFGADLPPPDTSGTVFQVRLARDGRCIAVAPEQTILDALQSAGIDVPCSCLQGVCGACETRVLDGLPDHRDLVLSEAERERGDTMMICCSRARSPELVLDL